MSTLLKKGNKALSVGVTVTTIVWTLGLAALAPAAQAQTLSAGDLLQCKSTDIKCPKDRALYWFTSDGKRLTFPNEKTFKTWYEDFKSATIKQVSYDELAAIPLAGNVINRPGTRLGKITTDPKTYAIGPGGKLHWIKTEADAVKLYGAKWASLIDDIPDVFFGNYTAGDALDTPKLTDGRVVKTAASEDLYLVWDGKKRKLADFNAFKANNLNSAYISTVGQDLLDATPAGDAVTAAESKLTSPWAQGAAKASETIAPGTLEVMAGPDSPTAGTLVAGQSGAQLLQLKLTNKGTGAMTLSSLKLKRIGVGADATLPAIYLYEGSRRITDSATLSQTYTTFNNIDYSLPVGSTNLWVVSNIVAGSSGQTVGLSLEAAASMTTKAGDTIAGTFPINGGVLSIGSATPAGVDFNATTLPLASSINPQDGFTAWQNTVSITTRDVYLKRFALKLVGSIAAADVANFRLTVDGVQAGDAVAKLDSSNFVTFDLSAKPMTLKPGNRIFKMIADVKGGTSRTMSFQLRDAADVLLSDSELNVGVLATVATAAFSARNTGDQTINSGSLTVTKTSDSPSGNVVNSSSGAVLARYELVATGEKIKIDSLTPSFVHNVGTTTVTLRNGALYVKEAGDADWRAVGSVATLTTAGTQYNLGGAMIIDPAKKMSLEVRADIFDNAVVNELAAGNTLQVSLNIGASNATRQVTGTTLNAPEAAVAANVLTVQAGSPTLTKDQSFGNQTYVVPKQTSLLGKWTLKNAGYTEDLNLNTFYLDIDLDVDDNSVVDNDEFGVADLTQVYIKYGTKTVSARSSVTATTLANTWSVSETLKKGESMIIEAYGDIASGATVTSTAADQIETLLRVDVTAAISSTSSNTGLVEGQTITATGAGTLTVSEDNTTPIANQAIAGSTSDNGALKVKLTTSRGETINVKDLSFYTTATAADIGVASATLWKASNSSGPWTQVGSAETFDANSTAPGFVRWTLAGEQRIAVAENSSVYLLLKPNYVSSGQATAGAISGLTPTFMLADLQADGSTGAMAASGTSTGTLVNSIGLIIQSNSSATYAAATGNEVLAAAVTTATATSLTTANLTAFTAGDLIFIDQDGVGDWDPATEELMMVLADGGAALTVKRGVYGTTAQAAYTNARPLFRLDNATTTNRGIVGNSTTLLDTKLAITNTGTPAGSATGGTAKEVFRVVASATLNSVDPAENKATITRIDFTNTKSGTSVANLVMYPSDHDLDATYRTTCGGLSTTEWRCTLATAGATNEVVEGASRTYIVRGDVGFAADGSVEFSIANLGTADAATNDVSWTDGDTPQVWIDQPLKELKATSALKNPSSTSTSGTRDTTRPTISSIAFANTITDNTLAATDTITVTFSEMIDPSDIAATLVPGGAAVVPANGATGDVSMAITTGIVTITGIATTDVDAGATAAAATYTTSMTLNAAGTVLTITLSTLDSGTGALTGAEVFGDITAVETVISDINADSTVTNLLQDAAVNASGAI